MVKNDGFMGPTVELGGAWHPFGAILEQIRELHPLAQAERLFRQPVIRAPGVREDVASTITTLATTVVTRVRQLAP